MDRRNILRVTLFLLFLLFVFSFWTEITFCWRWIAGRTPATTQVSHSCRVMTVNGSFFVTFFVVWLFIAASNAIFPVTRFREIILTTLYLFLHFLGLHGTAAYIRN